MGEKKKVLYILGPFEYQRGMDDYAAIDDMLTDLGYATISPVLIPEDLDKGKAHFIAAAMINSADAVVALPDWQTSKDAVVEHHLAYGFGKPMVEIRDKSCEFGDGVNPPEVVKAWLMHDLEAALGEESAGTPQQPIPIPARRVRE